MAEIEAPDNPEHAWTAPHAQHALLTALSRSGNKLVAVGAHGHILTAATSTPKQWQQASVPASLLLTAVHMIDERVGWAVGHDAVILSTQDGGSTWQKRFSDVAEERPLFDIWFRDESYGIAIGAYGYFLETHDGGMSWHDRLIDEENDYHLNAITENGLDQLFIAAESGHVYRSSDRGETWQVLNPPYHGSFFGIAAIGELVVVTGLRGHVFVSRDAGDSWQQIETDVETTMASVMPVNDNQFIIVGHAGVILLLDTRDDSVLMYRQEARNTYSDLVVGNQGDLVLVGEHGISLRNLCDLFGDKPGEICQ